MYTNFNEKSKLDLKHEAEYLCVIKGYKNRFYYSVLTWYKNENGIGRYDYDGMGFYTYNSEWGNCKVDDVVAYKEIETYEEQIQLS